MIIENIMGISITMCKEDTFKCLGLKCDSCNNCLFYVRDIARIVCMQCLTHRTVSIDLLKPRWILNERYEKIKDIKVIVKIINIRKSYEFNQCQQLSE